jgi:signal transduction histidine kinase/DNA-binding response OmpR family regulator
MNEIKVLMIDDDLEDYLITDDLLSEIQNSRKYILEWVPDYNKGVEAILQGAHDVYLIDYMIGANNGLELIKELREKGCLAPLILLTGQQNPNLDEQAIAVGASDYLVKGQHKTAELIDRAIRYEIRNAENIRKINQLNHELEEKVLERTTRLTETVSRLAKANVMLQGTLEEKERIAAALKESEKVYSSIAKNFPAGIIGILNSDFNFVFIEGTEVRKSNTLNYNLLGKNFLEVVPAAKAEKVKLLIQQARAGLATEFEMECGKEMYSVYIQPLSDNFGEHSQFLTVLRNITDQKKMELNMRNALQKEIQLNELKSRFVTMASHEFRTPLAALTTSLSLTEQYLQPEPDSKVARHIKRMRFSIKQLTEILNDFLSLEKLEQGKVERICEEFNLEELCLRIVEGLDSMLKPGQKINLNWQGDPVVYTDSRMVQNILLNLLSNAIKYSEEESEIWLNIHADEENTRIHVKDSGIGIPDADQTMMFNKFFRAGNVTNIQGTGLGLNIVKRYVQLLNGTIHFESKLQEGTSFFVNLQRLKKPATTISEE